MPASSRRATSSRGPRGSASAASVFRGVVAWRRRARRLGVFEASATPPAFSGSPRKRERSERLPWGEACDLGGVRRRQGLEDTPDCNDVRVRRVAGPLLAVTVALVLADSAVVTLALPDILRHLDTTVAQVAWVLISFNL